MRILVAAMFLAVALGGCGAAESPAAPYLQQVRKDVPSMDDVSDADLLVYGRYACKNPNTPTSFTFSGHGPTKGNEMEGLYKSAMRHCDALSK